MDADAGSGERPPVTAGEPASLDFDHDLAAAVNAALVGELDEGLAVDPRTPFGDERRLFAALYLRHRYTIGQHAWRYLHDRRDVDEVVQETFLRLFLALPDLDSEAQAIAWCRRTATNLCIDRYRAAQRRPSLVDLEHVAHELVVDDDPVDPLVQAEDAAVVRHALSLLSPLHRDALVKREIEEKSLQDIAVELDIPEESVKHLLYRARRALRRLLADSSVAPGRGTALLLIVAVVLSLPSVVVPALRRAVDRGRPPATVGSPSARTGLSAVPAPALTQDAAAGTGAALSSSTSAPGDPGAATGSAAADTGAPAALVAAGPALPAADQVATLPSGEADEAAEMTPPRLARPPRTPVTTTPASPAHAEPAIPAAGSSPATPPPPPPPAPSSPARPETSGQVGISAAPPIVEDPADVITPGVVVEPRFQLSGLPVISSEGWIEQQALDLDATGATTARSRFVGQTLDLDLTLNQSVRRNTDQSIRFELDAELVSFGEVIETTTVTDGTTAVTNDDGTVTVSAIATLGTPLPDPSLRAFGPAPTSPAAAAAVPRHVRVVVVYSGDLTRVLRESVHAS